MAQHARPNVAGHMDRLRAHPTARSRDVSRMPRSTSSPTSSGVVPRWMPSRRSTGTDDLQRWFHIDAGTQLLFDGRNDRPVQPALAPDVDVDHEHERDEHRHLSQAEQPELADRDRPGEEEDRLDVEDDEQHRDDVELDREPFASG